jgi:hypothetical protein
MGPASESPMKGVTMSIGESRKYHPRELNHRLPHGRNCDVTDVDRSKYPTLGHQRHVVFEAIR